MEAAQKTGFPVLLKATGGGGGIGIYICRDAEEVRTQFAAAGRCGYEKFSLSLKKKHCDSVLRWKGILW